jgi:hypothetical protein
MIAIAMRFALFALHSSGLKSKTNDHNINEHAISNSRVKQARS